MNIYKPKIYVKPYNFKCDFISILYNSLNSCEIIHNPNNTFSIKPVKHLTHSIHSKPVNKYSLQRKKHIRRRGK